MLEDEHEEYFHLKNLSMHAADNEEDALNLLFMGDTNRAIAETPMNMASSRSPCIFSLAIEARVVGSDVIRRSKLHILWTWQVVSASGKPIAAGVCLRRLNTLTHRYFT